MSIKRAFVEYQKGEADEAGGSDEKIKNRRGAS